MLLSAVLLLAATQSGAPSSLADILARGASVVARTPLYASKEEALQAIEIRQACRAAGLEYAGRPPAQAKVQRLGDLPPANHTLTVLRSVDGCPVSSTVRYNVDLPPRR